ncbi:MAG: triose-phosphate isomerase [Capsulimonadales bacterium]|nr:triose-phosphate isomerase [Capsulimonadales bacterium]
MSRVKIIAGNWKLNRGTATEAAALISELAGALPTESSAEIVVCPPFTALLSLRDALSAAPQAIRLGAQDVFWKNSGAYTGQISAPMLVDLGVRYVIIGHSERRGRFGVPEPDFTPDILKQFGETDATVNLKAKAALGAGLIPILCIGETLAEREAGDTDSVVRTQVEGALSGISAEAVAGLIFAYEPVWAIGTGKVCEPDEADRVCGVVRETVGSLYGAATADAVRVQYGGSMKPDNAADLLARPNIDGGLVGGASLKAADFAAIVSAAQVRQESTQG